MEDEHNFILQKLIGELIKVSAFEEYSARSLLLENIPGKDFISRSPENKASDLGIIVHFVASLGLLPGDRNALEILSTNLQPLLPKNTSQAEAIESFFARLVSPPVISPADAEIPFINRQDEMRDLLSSTAPPYHVLEGPAGYGKTKLLSVLHARFKDEKKYLSVLVAAHQQPGLLRMIQDIHASLGLSQNPVLSTTLPDESQAQEELLSRMGREHANEICDLYFGSNNGAQRKPISGVVLLVDNLDALPENEIHLFLGHYLPAMEQHLSLIEPFSLGGCFRVIVSLRYLTSTNNYIMRYLPAKVSLKPFAFYYVKQTVTSVLSRPPRLHVEAHIEQFTADIMHTTAGHPECIIKVLDLYREKKGLPPVFMREHSTQIWSGIVQPKIMDIRSGIPEHLHPIFSTLSIFREFNVAILENLIKDGDIAWSKSKHQLADELTGTFLYERNGRVLRDSITRRLFVLERRRLLEGQAFSLACQKAYDLYFSMLNQHSDAWAVECFYQFLQKSIQEIDDPYKRRKLEDELYARIIPEVLDAYLKGSDDRKADLTALRQKIYDDWELRFTLNYFLRDDNHFDEQPYRKFIKTADQWQ